MTIDLYFKNGTILKNIEIGIKSTATNHVNIIDDEYTLRKLLNYSKLNKVNTDNEDINFISNVCSGTFKKSVLLKYEINLKQEKNLQNINSNDNSYDYHNSHNQYNYLHNLNFEEEDSQGLDNKHIITYKDTIANLPPIAYFFQGYKLKHSISVSNLMNEITSLDSNNFSDEEKKLLETAALYHEIGYSDKTKYLDFYPLDGSIYIYHTTKNKMLASIIKYHSFSEELAPQNLKIYFDYNNPSINSSLKEMVDLLTLCDIFVEYNGNITTDSLMDQYHKLINTFGENSQQALVFKENMPNLYSINEKFHVGSILKKYVNANLY